MRLPGLARRAGWGVADQVISSLVNFGLGIAVARVGTLEEFGAYGLAFAAYLVAINLTRPASMEPLIIRFSSGAPEAWRRAFAEATGALVVVGAGIGIVAIILGVVLGGFTGAVFVLLGLGLPGLTLQDGWRLGFFAERRGRAAFFNDLTWAVVLFGAIGVMSATDSITAFGVIAAWVIGGNLAAILGFVQAATRPRPASTRVWWRAQRDLGRPLVAEHVVTNVTSELTPFGIGLVTDIGAVGALRGAQLLLGPFNVLFQAISLVALPEAVRIAERSRRRLRGAAVVFSASLASGVLAVGLVVLALPEPMGVALLGETWAATREVMLPYTMVSVGMMAAAGPSVGLRAMGAGREILSVGIVRSVLTLVGAMIGAEYGGAPSAAAGMAVGTWIGTTFAWFRFLHVVDQPPVDQPPADPAVGGSADSAPAAA